MKKTLLALLLTVTLNAFAQPGRLDTTVVSSITMKGSEAAYYFSYLNGTTDSTDIAFLRSARDVIRATPNLTWNSNITLTNVPGKYVVAIYDIGRRIPAGEAIQVGLGVLNTISAITHPVIQYFVGVVDAGHNNEFIRHRTLGKNILID